MATTVGFNRKLRLRCLLLVLALLVGSVGFASHGHDSLEADTSCADCLHLRHHHSAPPSAVPPPIADVTPEAFVPGHVTSRAWRPVQTPNARAPPLSLVENR